LSVNIFNPAAITLKSHSSPGPHLRFSIGKSARLFAWFVCVACLYLLPVPQLAFAAEPSAEMLSLGTGGMFRLGLWTEARVQIDGGDTGFEGNAELILPDGDGFATRFVSPQLVSIKVPAGQRVDFRFPVKVGRSEADARIVLLDRAGQEVFSKSQAIARLGKPLPPLQRFFIMIGEDQDVETELTSGNQLLPEDERAIVVKLKSLDELPRTWRAGQGIDLIYLSTTGRTAADFNAESVAALVEWIRWGGKLIFTAGAEGGELLGEGQPLAELVPGRFEQIDRLYDSSEIENFVEAQSQLLTNDSEFITISRIRLDGLAIFTDDDIPLVARKRMGFGEVTMIAFALDQQPLTSWKYRTALASRFLRRDISSARNQREEAVGRVSHLGYTDLSGQLRVALDKFSQVSFLTFTLVAVLTIAYILCIGPGDYFLLKKLFGRMELTWITFPLITLLFAGAALMIYRHSRTDQLQVNQIEVIDVDARSSLARGRVWAHIYSPETRMVSLSFSTEQLPTSFETEEMFVSWNGFPSDALGGMTGNATTQIVDLPYRMYLPAQGEPGGLKDMPLQVASTRAVTAEWSGTAKLDLDVQLSSQGDDSSLNGRFQNPLPIELSDVSLFYGDWSYSLDHDLGPGENVDVRADMREKSLSGFLTRRTLIDGKDVTPTWNPTDDDAARILEMIMFYEVAGGERYLKLTQRFDKESDFSKFISRKTAILVGRTARATNQIAIDGQPQSDHYDLQSTFYRVILPVDWKE
jgi:hypothetical protein